MAIDDEQPDEKGAKLWARDRLLEVEELSVLLNAILDVVFAENPELADKVLSILNRQGRKSNSSNARYRAAERIRLSLGRIRDRNRQC